MDTTTMLVIVAGFVVALGLAIALDRYFLVRSIRNRIADVSRRAEGLLLDAEQKAEAFHQEKVLKTEEEWNRRRETFEREEQEAKRAIRRTRQRLEHRQEKLARRNTKLNEREHLLHKATEAVDALRVEVERHRQDAESLRRDAEALLQDIRRREQKIEGQEKALSDRDARLRKEEEELKKLTADHIHRLEQISGLSKEDARKALVEQLLSEAKFEAASMIKEVRDEARLSANRQAKKIVLTAIQRTAANHTIENSVSVVNIQSDEMKGRIIGREGRNIRAFEAATGIEVIVDDTPEAVILSGFDPIRREVARIALMKLVQDGRIHPGRIEEVVEKVRAEIEEEIVETGERTVIDLGLHGMHPELVRLVGRMRYRSSYGQNLLAHSIEVANIASLMAAEIEIDARKARRAGLLHDIGKVVEGDIESPHALVGMDLCRKYKEHPDVCNAVGAHHDEIEMTSLISPIVQSADAISGARPGARREALESYIKRLEKLEQMARSFKGVDRVFAIQAGREIRVIVNHDVVSDVHAEQLALDIAKKIEAEMQYPGQIKVTVIREVRSVSYAK